MCFSLPLARGHNGLHLGEGGGLSESPLETEGLGAGLGVRTGGDASVQEEGKSGHFPSHQLQVHPAWSCSPEGRSGDLGVLSGEE